MEPEVAKSCGSIDKYTGGAAELILSAFQYVWIFALLFRIMIIDT